MVDLHKRFPFQNHPPIQNVTPARPIVRRQPSAPASELRSQPSSHSVKKEVVRADDFAINAGAHDDNSDDDAVMLIPYKPAYVDANQGTSKNAAMDDAMAGLALTGGFGSSSWRGNLRRDVERHLSMDGMFEVVPNVEW